jgi:drug/metabolite transporter (DMT)-like permease
MYVSSSIQLLGAGIFCLFISFLHGDFSTFSVDTVLPESFYALMYLAIVSSLFTFLAFAWLIRVQPPAIVSTYAYVNPLIATLLGWTFANEHISWAQLVALIIILTGVLFVNIPRYRTT